MWLGVRNDATHDMGDRPLPSTHQSASPQTVGQDMMSSPIDFLIAADTRLARR
jgi:hypothetical protein